MAKRSKSCPPKSKYKVTKGGRTVSTHRKKKAATASAKRSGGRLGRC